MEPVESPVPCRGAQAPVDLPECEAVQVVIRANEYCEVCGAKNHFRRGARGRTVTTADGERMFYGTCARCGAKVKVFWTDKA